MAILCGWASQSEHGTVSGKAGDQTGREVKTGPWYNFGQTEVFRWKNRDRAKKFASIIKYWCNDADVGYDQYERTTLGSWCKKHDWSYKVDKKVETDCSRMVADGINCTMGKEVIKLDQTFYTGNMSEVLMKTGLFTKLTGSKYCKDDDYLEVGDIINNPARHVITALTNGSKIKTTKPAKKSIETIAKEVREGKWGNGVDRTEKLKKAGYSAAEIKKIQAEVNKLEKASKKKKSISEVAKEVDNGKWGNGETRVKKLKAAGYTDAEIKKIQAKVNAMH